MPGILQNAFSIILIVEHIAGNLGNGFIVLLNCMDWVKGRKLSSADKILTALAISRIGLLWSVLLSMLISVVPPGLLMTAKSFEMINIASTVTNHFNVWFATCLSIFYLLKIANFSSSIFLYLKWKIEKVVLVTLLVSLIPLFLNTMVMDKHIDIWLAGSKGNMSYSSGLSNSTKVPKIFLFANSMFTFVPFTISLMAFLLLIISLWKHHKKMQRNPTRSRDASTTAHVKAIQTGITFLLLYSLGIISLVIKVSKFELLEINMIILLDHGTGIGFLTGHTYVLILGNSKLRRASLTVLGWLRCRSKGAETWGS